MCRITDPVLLKVWTQMYGSTYHEVTGRNLVQKFTYFGETYAVGDIIEMFDPRTGALSMEAEIVSVGSNMHIRRSKRSLLDPTNRRAVLLKVIRQHLNSGYTPGRTMGAFLWGHDQKRIRHAALEALARI